MAGETLAEVPGEKSLGGGSRWWGRALCGLLPLAGLELVGLPLGCGPSIQPIHEGGVRFEHCYRLDLDPKIAPPHRHACWKQWLEVYSYGQSRDRIEYSRRRVHDLEAGDPNPPQLNLDQAAEAREARQFYMATPAPTSVHAPPPPMATPEPSAALAPGDPCVASCQSVRSQCLTRCGQPADNAPPPPPAAPAAPPSAQPPVPTPQPSAKPAASPTAAAAKPTESSEAGKESAVGECECERDYKICGARCFE